MADLYNATFNRTEKIHDVKSGTGVFLSGKFTNGSTFHGPRLLNFECSGHDNDMLVFGVIMSCYFLIMVLSSYAGYIYGRVQLSEEIAFKSKDEQERIQCVHRALGQWNTPGYYYTFKVWPGEKVAKKNEEKRTEKEEKTEMTQMEYDV